MSFEIAEDLSRQTSELLSRFERRAAAFSNRQDLASFVLPSDQAAAEKTAREFFGPGEHLATGIDGSMDFDERLQMILFYANATAYSCSFRVAEHLSLDLSGAYRESKMDASAAIPLWAEDLSNVLTNEPEIDIELEHSVERIPNSFMTLGELYLGYRACEKSRILFMDRPLSGTYSALSRDVRLLLRRGETKLTRWSPDFPATLLDIRLALSLGSPSMAVPTRGRYLHAAMLKRLLAGPASVADLSKTFKVREAEASKAAARLLRFDKEVGGSVLSDSAESHLEVRDEVRGYWSRTLALSVDYASKVFSRSRHPLALKADEYLTMLDVSAVSLFLLQGLLDRASEKRTLLVGIAKDTSATDVARSVLPFASSGGFLRLGSPAPMLRNDRAFLAILSAENPEITTPWRTMGYDSAFSTIANVGGELRSARKLVSRERLFVRSYFQLRTLRSDRKVRSQVFLFDRPFGEGDEGAERQVRVKEKSGMTDVGAYFEGDHLSKTSNLVLHILSMADNPEVFEAFGHNQLLYLADKAVKAEVRMLRSSLRGVADLSAGGVSNRRKIFGLVTPYRQQRAEAEHARMKQ